MTAIAKKPLNRKLAIGFSVGVMWLGGSLGLWFLHASHRWYFILLDGYDWGTLGQIGGYYLARVGIQFPAVGLAAIIIGLSDFRHPVRTACITAFAYHGMMTAIRLVVRPWSLAPNLDQSIPVLAEGTQLVVLVGLAGLITWLFIWLATRLATGPLARYVAH